MTNTDAMIKVENMHFVEIILHDVRITYKRLLM